MVDLLDERFLVHNAVHKPTIRLLRFCVLDERQRELDHEDVVDLMYIICSKIHGFPALLNIFFHDKHWLTTPQKTLDTHTDPQYEFLLFTYLLRFVHREGRSGDYARTGLLFLMEMATDQLGDFIFQSDFATIMAAGLGALYSQLPRKLIVKDEDEINQTTSSYLLGQDLDPRSFPSDEAGAELSSSASFKYRLDSFLKLVEFCQDILLRCPHEAISKRLLVCIQMIFVENILYPSILECSDHDGSSVAVVSYIDLMLQTIQQPDLAHVVVGYLTGEPCLEDPTLGDHPMSAYAAAERYTLKDLILSRLSSVSQPTVIATLKLLKTLVVKHCSYADHVVSTVPDTTEPSMIVSHHLKEIELYFGLVSAMHPTHAEDRLVLGYEHYLNDVESAFDSNPCYHHLLHPDALKKPKKTSKSEKRRSFKYGQQQYSDTPPKRLLVVVVPEHRGRKRIPSTDRLMHRLLDLLSHFLAQSSELNLALTSVISALALCPYRSLEGWITFQASDRADPNHILSLTQEGGAQWMTTQPRLNRLPIPKTEDDDDDASLDEAIADSGSMTAPIQFKSFPPFYTLLRTLTQQIDYYRSEIDGFDQLLQERWQALLMEPMCRTVSMEPSWSITNTSSPSVSKLLGLYPPTNPRRTSVVSTAITTTTELPWMIQAKKTMQIRIEPLFPSTFEIERQPILNLDEEDQDVFAAPTVPSETSRRRTKRKAATDISLSTLLNNTVILQETIKEWVATMQVRRSLGLDRVRFT
ncbi:Retinoic acid induced 16-like protein-domain-containing protein [Gilbertella persicaria]|uniref:Retinoic acid induced 16-like protein-domain-containing protein n=1 Tax=Gilbertella persicaria TaxID=101096 RepID=UPI002220219C|nr:Retinoic acid induced 16-like protein-domain-containing protein [Gilbertella persicaria]KAI8068120.1 Retinoic acid induced 16-like protein-domain-containing protein [Gilbertella persicaria]